MQVMLNKVKLRYIVSTKLEGEIWRQCYPKELLCGTVLKN